MKRYLDKRFAVLAAVAGLAVLTGCGSRSDGGGVGGFGSGQYGGCANIAGQIGFQGTGIYFGSNAIMAGAIPSNVKSINAGRTYGSLLLGAPQGGPYQRTTQDGTISMNITPVGNTGGYPYPANGGYMYPTQPITTTANMTGFLTLSAAVQSDIALKWGVYQNAGYGGYNPMNPSLPGIAQPVVSDLCVTAIALEGSHTYQGYQLYGNAVYLTLSRPSPRGEHGYIVYP